MKYGTELSRVEKLALEAVAIGMFESFLRQQATEGRGITVQDWKDLTVDARNSWRDSAADMLSEMSDR
jgi:hypothetical protein